MTVTWFVVALSRPAWDELFVLLVGTALSFGAGLGRRNGVTAVSGVPGRSVVQDTCCGSDTETAYRRRHVSFVHMQSFSRSLLAR